MDKMKIGITEAGDAGLDFSWVDKLFDINIIITKHLTTKNEQLIKALLENSHKIILHCTCTGYGGTKMEQNVPTPLEVHDGIKTLIQKGFPDIKCCIKNRPNYSNHKGHSKS